MARETMNFHDDRYGSEMHVSTSTDWKYGDGFRYIVSDDARWVRIDQNMVTKFSGAFWPYSTQKIDAMARALVPGARVVSSTQYGLDAVETWTRTYKVGGGKK